MSTTRTRELLYRSKAKSTSDDDRVLLAVEHDNSVDFSATKYPTFFNRNGIKDVTLYAHTYVRIECMIQCNSEFKYCEVVITDRFTMDSKRFPLDYTNAQDSETDPDHNPKYYNAQIKNYSIAQYAVDQQNRTDDDPRVNNKKFTNVTLVLSMADFPHFGDIDFQFYDSVDKKDEYSDPAIVQFTNAPTIYIADIYKWRPNLAASTSAIEDYDNVFASGFGSRLSGVPNTGRVNVLTGNVADSDSYNDILSADRLITNGYRNDEITASYSGHPVYMIEYVGIVPSSFSSAFGIPDGNVRKPVTFSAIGQKDNGDSSAYLVSAMDFNINNPDRLQDAYALRMYTRDDDIFFPYSAVPLVSSTTAQYNTTITASIRKFIAHCTAFSGDKDDKWFREHTRVCADFALAGVDPEWISEP